MEHHASSSSVVALSCSSQKVTQVALAQSHLLRLVSLGRPSHRTGLPISFDSKQQGRHLRPFQGQGLYFSQLLECRSMALRASTPLSYLEQIQGLCAPTIQKESFSLTVYSMGVRTIEESLGVEGKFFNSQDWITSSSPTLSVSMQCWI